MKKGPRGCLGYIGDEILPSYVVIIINRYKLKILVKQPA